MASLSDRRRVDRRRIGSVILVVGLLAAVVVPMVTGRVVSGSPQAVPVSGPPAVGECLGQKFNPSWDMVGGEAAAYVYPELVVGDCGRTHYGEVVSVIAAPTKPKVTTNPDSGGFSIEDKNMDACYSAANRFVQADGAAPFPSVQFDYWSSVDFAKAIALTPTIRQRASGQHWVACATMLLDESDAGQRFLVGYAGSLRSADTTGVGRNHRGDCPKETDWNNVTSVSCLEAHPGEIFGVGGLSQNTSRTTLMASCAHLVHQATGNADLEGDGRLVIAVQATDGGGEPLTAATVPQSSSVQCGVLTSGGRMLKGSLIAIGSAPIPWA